MAQPVTPGKENRWEEALQLVQRGGVVPLDALHVTALLEMGGWTDSRANQEFGFDDLFTMGEEVYQQIQVRISQKTFARPNPHPWYRWLSMGFLFYLRGLLFAMPMVVSVMAMLLLGYSLWSDETFSTEQATGIAIGTIASFLVTGGYSQAIARRGLFYLSMKEFTLARRMSFRLMGFGMATSFLVGAAVLLINLVVPFFPWRLLGFAAPYYFFLCLLWLTITVLYMMQREMIFTTITMLGIACVWGLKEYLQWPTIWAQMVGLSVSTAISLLVALYLFFRDERREDAGTGEVALPRWSQVTLNLHPFFFFGILYFSFLYLDRLVAWSVPDKLHPYPIWFLGEYELGLDWAILTLVAPMGVLELFINVFSLRVLYWQANTRGADWKSFNQRFQKTYLLQILTLFVISAVGGYLVWWFVGEVNTLGLLDVEVFHSAVTKYVFIIGTIAYVFVSLGLMNCLMLFSLNIPWPGVQAVGLALLTDLVLGFLLSRVWEYQHAVLGLLAGSLVFAIASGTYVYRTLGRLDYVLYRSL